MQALVFQIEGRLHPHRTFRFQPLVREHNSVRAEGKAQLMNAAASRIESVVGETPLELGIAEDCLPRSLVAQILTGAQDKGSPAIPSAFLAKCSARKSLNRPIADKVAEPPRYVGRMD
jgi:hypothetical protein